MNIVDKQNQLLLGRRFALELQQLGCDKFITIELILDEKLKLVINENELLKEILRFLEFQNIQWECSQVECVEILIVDGVFNEHCGRLNQK